MNLVEVLGGWINTDHIICAVENDYDTRGFVSLSLTNGDSVPMRKKLMHDLLLFRVNSKVWINPEHVSSVGLNRINDETVVEIVMDVAKYKVSFAAEGSTKEDVYAWVETLKTWKELM